jgi:hypothetical protein
VEAVLRRTKTFKKDLTIALFFLGTVFFNFLKLKSKKYFLFKIIFSRSSHCGHEINDFMTPYTITPILLAQLKWLRCWCGLGGVMPHAQNEYCFVMEDAVAIGVEVGASRPSFWERSGLVSFVKFGSKPSPTHFNVKMPKHHKPIPYKCVWGVFENLDNVPEHKRESTVNSLKHSDDARGD